MDFETAAWHVARAHPHGLSQIRLLKLIWLAELKHFQRTGSRLTDANWFRYDYGPYTKRLNKVKDETPRFFHVAKEGTPAGHRAIVIRANSTEPPADAPQDELKSLNDTLWLYEKFTTEELLAEVYQDPFFEDTPFSHDFDFDRLPDFRQVELTPERLRKLERALGAAQVPHAMAPPLQCGLRQGIGFGDWARRRHDAPRREEDGQDSGRPQPCR